MVDKMLMFSHHKIPFMLVKVLQVKKISLDNKAKQNVSISDPITSSWW